MPLACRHTRALIALCLLSMMLTADVLARLLCAADSLHP